MEGETYTFCNLVSIHDYMNYTRVMTHKEQKYAKAVV
jgi:hypothetical protein